MNTPEKTEPTNPLNPPQPTPSLPVPSTPSSEGKSEEQKPEAPVPPTVVAESSIQPVETPNPMPLPGVSPVPTNSPAPAQKADVTIHAAIGQIVEALTETEQMDLYSYEEVIGMGWSAYVQVGLALGQICTRRLYRTEFFTFEEYCRKKWAYGRNYVDRLISAAQVFTHIVTNCHEKPDRESQVRPLIGLTPENIKVAWENAVKKAGGRKITERLIKAAVRELQGTSAEQPLKPCRRLTRIDKRRVIDGKIGELLLLLSQKADHGLLTQKVEELHRQIRTLFAVRKPKAGDV